jgi:hypothetical protein
MLNNAMIPCLSSPDGHVRFDQQRTWAKLPNRRDGPSPVLQQRRLAALIA